MANKINLNWFCAAGIRAVKTVAQTALGMLTVGAAFTEINWTHILAVSATSGIISILTSLATKLPELEGK